MNHGSVAVVLGGLVTPLGLFRRRAKDEWLGELADIRHDALGVHGGGLDESSPSESPPSESSPSESSPSESPPSESSPSESSPSESTPTGPDLTVEADPTVEPEPDGGGPAVVEQVAPAVSEAVAVSRPAPHRQRPGELWHPALELGRVAPAEIQPEERLDPAEVVEPEPDASFAARARPFVGGGPTPEPVERESEPSLDLGADLATLGRSGLDVADIPFPEVVAAGDLVDDAEPPAPRVDRVRIRPPSEVFDASPPDPTPTRPLLDDGEGGPTGGSVERTSWVDDSRRSLFGRSGVLAGERVPAGRSGEGELEVLEVRADDTVALATGTVRLAPGCRPEVSRLGGTVGLTLEDGWCWVASASGADPVLVGLPGASLGVPPGGHALAVVEGDGSAFVSVVRGTAKLERPDGQLDLPVGCIAHLRTDGTVHTDRATPEEMATDSILTRNLYLDEIAGSSAV